MTDAMTVEEIVGELGEMLEVSRGDGGIARRLAGDRLTIVYEFLTPDGGLAAYQMTIDGDRRDISAIQSTPESADVVLRTTPATLHDVSSGDLNGREAIMSGRLDIRKAPSLPKLLMLRGMLNQYQKSLRRSGS